MKALFVHDHRFVHSDGKTYSNQLPYAVWERYLGSFTRLTVLARQQPVKQTSVAMKQSSGPQVTFHFLQSASSIRAQVFHRSSIIRTMEDQFHKHDVGIFRLPSELGLLGIQAAKRLGKPYLVEVVSCGWDAAWNHGSVLAKMYAPLLLQRMRKAVAGAPYTIYVTQSELQRRYPARTARRIAAVSNVELPAPDKNVLQSRLSRISKNTAWLKLGMMGSMQTRYKGVDVAIRALQYIRQSLPRVTLHILGSGNPGRYQDLARKLGLGDSVVFEGVLPSGPVVYEWLDSMDIYCQPSFVEGVPRALLEAMSRGCPSVGSRVGGIPEVLDAESMFPAGDHKKMASIIAALGRNHEQMANRAKQGFRTAGDFQKSILEARRTALLDRICSDLAASRSRAD